MKSIKSIWTLTTIAMLTIGGSEGLRSGARGRRIREIPPMAPLPAEYSMQVLLL
jgi:hypothetical protein